MKTFTVTSTGYVNVHTTIEAKSLEEAKEKSKNLCSYDFYAGGLEDIDWDQLNIEEDTD